MKKNQIIFLDKFTKGTWKLNPLTGRVDIEGDFIYTDFPRDVKSHLRGVKFGEVTGNFIFEPSQALTSFFPIIPVNPEDFPRKVGKTFSCSTCSLKSLVGGPEEVGGNYYCSFNKLENFEGAPERVTGSFVGRFNHDLTSFKGIPKFIGGDLNLQDGNYWQQTLDTNNLNIVSESEIKGAIKFDGKYREYFLQKA
jgi:hypothetical protein